MLYVFEAIKNHFHSRGDLKRLCREIYYEPNKSDDKTARTQPCVIVTSNGEETFPTDSHVIEVYELSLTVFSNKVQPHVAGGILEQVAAVKAAFDDQKIEHPAFHTCQMNRRGSGQPRLVDGTYQAEIGYAMTVMWNDNPAELRYA